MTLSKQKYDKIIETYEKRWRDSEFLKQLDEQVDHGDKKDFAMKNQEFRHKIASEGAITFAKLKIYPTLKDCRKYKSSKKMVILRLKVIKSPVRGDEMQQARSMTLNGYIDTMIEIVEETL